MKRYMYDGPVMEFSNCIAHKWTAETMAVSKKKALSNFMFQFKKQNNRTVNAKISLPGEIKEVNERTYYGS